MYEVYFTGLCDCEGRARRLGNLRQELNCSLQAEDLISRGNLSFALKAGLSTDWMRPAHITEDNLLLRFSGL